MTVQGAVEKVGGAALGRAIIVLNPAEPDHRIALDLTARRPRRGEASLSVPADRLGLVDTRRRELAARFVELHREGCFLLPNAWDAGSARVLEPAGFPAVATTSAGVAFSLGRPDRDYAGTASDGDRVDRTTMIRRIGEIAAEVRIPVSADLEDGFGEVG
ncbi:isocitrate lyase/phosphoenolpyruvate mutase family protein [Streptomyces sp. NPDC054813]